MPSFLSLSHIELLNRAAFQASAHCSDSMELSGLAMDNFPAVAANDSKTLRKLSLLEARMVGAGNESRDASLPPNEGSRGSENNSNSM